MDISPDGDDPERDDYRVVVLKDRLAEAVARLNKKTGKYVFGYAKHMRDAFKNASFIGFTGTPIDKEDKDTRGVFGDYIGIGSELKQALKTYTDAKGKGQPTLKAEEALRVLHEKMDAVRGLFHGFDYSGYRDNALELLPPAANHILGIEKQNDKTVNLVMRFSRRSR